MKILPKNSEIDVVEAIIASDQFATSRDMSRAVVKAVMLELAKRETFAVAENDHPFEFFWPFFYEGDARRFSDSLPTIGGKRYLLKMSSPLSAASPSPTKETT
jgi:hypothetical protein